METPVLDPQPQMEQGPRMSLWGRMFNLFATPGDVFENVRTSPVNHLNWIVPGLFLLIVGVVGAQLVFSQPAIQQQVREMTAAAIEKQFEKANMPADQRERVLEQVEKYGSIGMQISTYAAPLFVGFVSPFAWGLFVWLVGSRLLKGEFGYFKAVEAMGLTSMIAALHFALKYLLVIVTGNFFASPSLVLMVKSFDATNPMHTLLAFADIILFWLVAVRGIGMARLSRASTGKCILLAFAFWVLYNAMMVGPSLLMQALNSR